MREDHYAYQYDHQTVKAIQPFKNFKDFCLNYWDFSSQLLGMPRGKAEALGRHGKFHFCKQSKWTHHKNENITDFIGKFENLHKDVKTLEDILGFKNSKIPHINKSNHKYYKDYYNQKMIDAVAEIYEEDIKNFNYGF